MTDTSKTTCVIPWTHVNIVPQGKVMHCCMNSDMNYFIGDLNKESLEEVWNSDNMKSIRKQMINGEKPQQCSKCYEQEDSSGSSMRLNQNKFFKKKLEEVESITLPDGHVDKIDIRYWDFRFSNICNLKCRTCGPSYSSAWIPDARKLGWINDITSKKLLNVNGVDDSTNIEFLEKYVNQVEKIYFAGGEPLLMDEHWQILDMLDRNQRYDVIITYNSNLSTLEYKNKNVLDYWKKWGRRIWLWPSIDDIDERAELIRSGTNWKNVEENLKAVSDIGIHVRPSITVSAMNVHRITKIIDRFIEIGVVKEEYENYLNFSLNVVEYSPHFHISILSDETRKRIREELEDYIENYKIRFNADIRHLFLHLFWHLEKPYNAELAESFKKFTNKIDIIRDENTLEVIPELKEVL
jgi:radical SAM protein with 4Fe4S-binding SPASM domain